MSHRHAHALLTTILALACLAGTVSRCFADATKALVAPETIVWTIDNVASIGGHAPQVLGHPKVIKDGATGRSALEFNGKTDGLIMPANPLAGCPKFTIEILFKPTTGGPAEQRFLHLQDEAGRRALIETRIVDGQWSLDTFLMAGENRLTLLDRAKLHPLDRWYWAALIYDGETMTHYVNGERELSGKVQFPSMTSGQTSLGVRLNQVYWFQGQVAEVRYCPSILPKNQLQR